MLSFTPDSPQQPNPKQHRGSRCSVHYSSSLQLLPSLSLLCSSQSAQAAVLQEKSPAWALHKPQYEHLLLCGLLHRLQGNTCSTNMEHLLPSSPTRCSLCCFLLFPLFLLSLPSVFCPFLNIFFQRHTAISAKGLSCDLRWVRWRLPSLPQTSNMTPSSWIGAACCFSCCCTSSLTLVFSHCTNGIHKMKILNALQHHLCYGTLKRPRNQLGKVLKLTSLSHLCLAS